MRRVLLLYVLIGVFVPSCIVDYYSHQLSITNNTGNELSVLYSNAVEAPTENNVDFYIADWETVKPDSTFTLTNHGKENAWHEYIQEGSAKKLYFYIFETDTLRKYRNIYNMKDMVAGGRYFKSMSYSEAEMGKIHWNLVVGK